MYFSNAWFIVTGIQKRPVDDLDSSSVADGLVLYLSSSLFLWLKDFKVILSTGGIIGVFLISCSR